MNDETRNEQTLKDDLIQVSSELCSIAGAPGFEQDVVAWLVEHLEPYADEIEVDRMGNLYALRHGDPAGPDVMVSAHSDEIGGVVRAIEPDGFLRFNKLGGVLDALLVGRMVMVDEHFGVVGVKAGHAQTEEERSRVLDASKLYIDVGAESRDEVLAMGIDVGSPVTYVSELRRFTNGDRFCGKAMDNRIGCAILLALLKSLQDVDLAGNLHAVVTVQEEIGLHGAQVAAYRTDPTCAIVVDTMPCGDTPDMGDEKNLPIGIGRGPVFRLASRRSVTHRGMKRLLIETAEAEGIPYQTVVHDRSSTDASIIRLQREGIPTAAITIPRRYSHTPIEMGDVKDVVATLRMLQALVDRFGDLDPYLSFMP
jgi:endoglucanase